MCFSTHYKWCKRLKASVLAVICCFLSGILIAQRNKPLNKAENVYDQLDLLFTRNNLSIIIAPSYYDDVNIKKQQGSYELRSQKQFGITAGFMHYTNFSKLYSFVKGLHISVSGRDE